MKPQDPGARAPVRKGWQLVPVPITHSPGAKLCKWVIYVANLSQVEGEGFEDIRTNRCFLPVDHEGDHVVLTAYPQITKTYPRVEE